MDIEDRLEPFKKGAEMLFLSAQDAIERGDSERARQFVMRSIRQGLIIRHLRANKKISRETLHEIMTADPEALYRIFADDPKICVNKEFIRPPVWKERYKPCRGGDFGMHKT